VALKCCRLSGSSRTCVEPKRCDTKTSLLACRVGILTDALGSVANITNSTGSATATYTYSPFGTARLNTQAAGYAGNPLKYTGQKLDPTGTYHPTLGRFTQTDPMPTGAGSSFEGSYVHGMNRPTVMVDPSGKRGRMALGSGGSNPVSPQPTVQTWSISPSARDWGRFEIRAFISTASTGGWIAPSAGDSRSFSASATCADSRACISVDFQAGSVRLETNVSCNPGKSSCVAPDSLNCTNVTGSASSLKLDYHLLNPKAPGNVPAIDRSWRSAEAQAMGPYLLPYRW
jgi:RHS repeat-associated protein